VTGTFGQVDVWTSHPHNITAAVKSYSWLRPHYARLPFGTVILGELHIPGKPASSVKTAIVEQWSNLKFSAFAVETLPANLGLPEVSAFCVGHGIEFIPWRKIVEGDTIEKLMEELPPSLEGYVLKDGNLLNWYKLKREKTIDLIFDDFLEGRGKYEGTVGSLICKTIEGYEVATVSGMTDEERWEISENAKRYFGRVVEVKYQCVGSGGRLRHPRFIRWRDDKLPEECGLEQDPDLEAYYESSSDFLPLL